MKKLFRNFGYFVLIIIVFVVVIYLYSNQSFIKFNWCNNCDLPRVVTTTCYGLKINERVLLEVGCNSFPI